MSDPTPSPDPSSTPRVVTEYADAIDLVRQPTSAVVLCGQIVPDGVGEPSEALRILTGPEQMFELPREFTPVVEYFQILRVEQAARADLAAAGAPDDTLDHMIDGGQLVRIRSTELSGIAQIFPSPILPVRPASAIASMTRPTGPRGGPRTIAPIRAMTPSTVCTTVDPAKSWNAVPPVRVDIHRS